MYYHKDFIDSFNQQMLVSRSAVPPLGQSEIAQQPFGFGAPAQQATNPFSVQQTTDGGVFESTPGSVLGQKEPAFWRADENSMRLRQACPLHQNFAFLGPTGTSNAFGFGTSKPAFGVPAQQGGTCVKFSALPGIDTIGPKNELTVATRMNCITLMQNYERKSLEELRYEDYAANRKGPQAPNIFGGIQPAESKPLFDGGFGPQPATSTAAFGGKPTGHNTTCAGTTGFGFGPGRPPICCSAFWENSKKETSRYLRKQPLDKSTIGLLRLRNKQPAVPTGFNFGQTSAPVGASQFGGKPKTVVFGSNKTIVEAAIAETNDCNKPIRPWLTIPAAEINFSFLSTLIRVTELSRSEAETLLDILRKKHPDDSCEHPDSIKNCKDSNAEDSKQLARKEEDLAYESTSSLDLQDKLTELTEINSENSEPAQAIGPYEEGIVTKENEQFRPHELAVDVEEGELSLDQKMQKLNMQVAEDGLLIRELRVKSQAQEAQLEKINNVIQSLLQREGRPASLNEGTERDEEENTKTSKEGIPSGIVATVAECERLKGGASQLDKGILELEPLLDFKNEEILEKEIVEAEIEKKTKLPGIVRRLAGKVSQLKINEEAKVENRLLAEIASLRSEMDKLKDDWKKIVVASTITKDKGLQVSAGEEQVIENLMDARTEKLKENLNSPEEDFVIVEEARDSKVEKLADLTGTVNQLQVVVATEEKLATVCNEKHSQQCGFDGEPEDAEEPIDD